MNNKHSLRQSMDYLHTWAGVLFSVLLFLVFFMGTLSVFDREIDRWMMPDTRLAPPTAVSFDRDALPHLQRLASNARLWTVHYPNSREPAMSLGWPTADGFQTRYVDVITGRVLADPGTKGASGFFYPFHYSFLVDWMDIGVWLLALVSIAMLALLVSGVIVHKKIFTDFFTFRPSKSMQRATLDLHNAAAVLLLPFHFIITLSGLIVFLFIYTEVGMTVIYAKDGGSIIKEAFAHVSRAPAKQPRELAPVDTMVQHAVGIWGSGDVGKIIIRNPGDSNALVEIQRRPHDRIVNDNLTVTFDGATGAVLSQQRLSPTLRVQRFFSGLHLIPFDHWGLRWMYFVMGLISCVMIGSGLLVWVEKRRMRHEKEGRSGYRVVNAVAVAGTVGLLVATLAMLVANKLLPAGMADRAVAEQLVFFGAWIACLLQALTRAFHAGSRTFLRIAWRDQTWTVAALAMVAMLLNAVMTGDHLLHTLSQGRLAVAGVDVVLVITAVLAGMVARRLAFQAATVQRAAAVSLQRDPV